MPSGGYRPGAGRKKKAEELERKRLREIQNQNQVLHPDKIKNQSHDFKPSETSQVENQNVQTGEQIRKASESLLMREAAKLARKTRESVPEYSLGEHPAGTENSHESVARPDHGRELHVLREGEQTSGNSGMVAQQVHSDSENAGGGTTESESASGTSAASDSDSDATDERTNREEASVADGGSSRTGAASKSDSERLKLIERLREPVYFARAFCLKKLDQWQCNLLNECKSPGLIALRGANGIGKTVIICVIILFFLSTVKNCRVVVVSGVFRQLKMMVDHLQSLLKNFPGWEIKRSAHELHSPFPENKAIWFATDSPGAAQGQHSVVESVDLDENAGFNDEEFRKVATEAKESKSCLVLIRDECHVIPREVKESTDTFGATWTFDLSFPGIADGWFWEAFSMLSHVYRLHKVTAYESSYVSREQIEKMEQTHGRESAIFQSSVLAEFSDASTKNVITVDMWDTCALCPPTWEPADNDGRVAGLDLSAAKKGGDKCILFPRDGNKILEPVKYTNFLNEMDLLAQVLVDIKRLKIRVIFADKGGLGSPMISLLESVLVDERLRVRIIRVDFGGHPVASNNPHKVKNRATEMLYGLIPKLIHKDYILPKDSETRQQAITRQIITNPDLSVRLVPKTDLPKSPDELDAFLLCLNEAPADFSHTSKTSKWYSNDAMSKEISTRRLNGYGMVGSTCLGRG